MTKKTLLTSLLITAMLASFQPLVMANSHQGKTVGLPLDDGFVSGMTPEQTCSLFKQNYKNSSWNNHLCRAIGKKNFANLKVVNSDITRSKLKGDPVKSVAFFFDRNQKLNYVISSRRSQWNVVLKVD
jgi:hypothetical protein